MEAPKEGSNANKTIETVSLSDTLRAGCDALRLVLLEDEHHGCIDDVPQALRPGVEVDFDG